MRKQVLKKVCGIERKRSQHLTQMGAGSRPYFLKNIGKKCIQQLMRKKGTERNHQVRKGLEPGLGRDFGPAGERFREGVWLVQYLIPSCSL